MRIVIDKDFNQRTLLQESYEKTKPTYKVCATNSEDRFVYATNLKNINEAVDATYDLAFDPIFDDCKYEICECLNGKEREVWTSDGGILIKESDEEGGFWSKLGNAAKKALDGLKKGINVVGAMTKQFSKDMLKKWREAGYFNKQGYITGLGYKVMTGQVKNTIPVDTGSDKTQDISNVWRAAQSNVVQALKKQGMTPIGNITAIVKNDKDAILLTADVQTKDGDEETLTFDQDGQTVDGNGAAVDPTKGGGNTGGNVGGNTGGNTGSGNTGGNVGGGMTNDEKKGVQSIVKRVDAIEQALRNNDILEESWSFNGVKTTKEGLERSAISTFFKQLNESDVKEIVFIEGNNKKVYDVNNGSISYSQFKKDVRESTGNAHKMFKESKDKTTKTYNMVVEFSKKSKLNGYKMSDFGGIDTPIRVVTFNVVKENTSPKPTKKLEKESNFKDGGKVNVDNVVPKKTITESTSVNESLVLEMDVVNPEDQIKALVASMNKFTSGKPETSPLTKPNANVSTTPVSIFGMPEQEVVAEAEGDEEGGGDEGGDEGGGEADPFATDDEGGGEADPFATDDADVGDEGGGDDAVGGGDTGGDDAGVAPGGNTGGDDMGGGGDAGGADTGGNNAETEDPNNPTGEPAPETAINTDAQGNQKSQYNINVTKAFNVDDTFELNEDEQKEFFGKIDQLVKIPDMENYALYLYQITPENVNLDDVHYITALYELSVKLGLLEDVYADSNLLEKYSSYKYSVVKNGEDGDNGKGGMTIQEDRKYVLMEGTDNPKVQKDNEKKNEKSKKVGSSKDDDERRGPKDMKLNKDENGADKPVIIDVNEYGWENKDKKLTSSTEMDDFRGLGWVVTFKAMQFGSPRYMTMYIKKNGNEKAETQCKKYLEKLSYSEIDIVKIEEIDPYEYVYRNGAAGMKSVEEVHGAAVVNKDIPYFESTKEEIEQPSVVKEGAMAKLIPEDIKRDVKCVLTKLNSEIRNTKQFNFSNECGVNKPQIDHVEFLNCYRTSKVDETVGDTTYKFILRKNDSMMSRMFYSNLQEKLFNYLGTFATKYNMECNCQACPTYIMIDFVRNDLNNPMGYDMDTMINTDEEPVV